MSGKILLIEDEQDLADIVVYNLEREGFSVFHANDGKKALEFIKNSEIHHF